MAFTLSAMQTEVYARGFNYLNDGGAGVTRVTRWLNDAMHAINELAEWPFLEATTTITAGSSIADLRAVRAVTDIGYLNQLRPADLRNLRQWYADLTTTGTAIYFYVTNLTTINTYPVTTSNLTVDYWKFAPDLVNAGDAPLMPDRFRMAIVHYAVAIGHRDADNDASAQTAQMDGDRLVGQMQSSLLNPQHQGPGLFAPLMGDDI